MNLAQAKALAHADRMAIMDALAARTTRNVQQLATLTNRSHSQTSQHLTILRNAGLITQRRYGTTTWNSLAPGVVWPI